MRRAEKRFRSMLIERDGVSPVSGSPSENSQAAHIVEVKHWRQFDPSSVGAMPSYTVRNGLLLDPNDHKFFDDHNFTIKAEEGEHGIRYFIELAPGWEPPERASHLQQGKEIKFKGPQESWPAMEYLEFRLKLFKAHNKMQASAGPRDRFGGDSDCTLDHEELLSFPQDPIMAKGSPGNDEGALACGPPLSDCADFVGQWVADVAKRMDLSGGAA
ncbi:hypothetical protein DFJ73DRAFT_287601 [Zopfochytrium polystomum]|nr:hypothetical protein DFJ73DRAFT_287601 [Zopfochytrium polystomum]